MPTDAASTLAVALDDRAGGSVIPLNVLGVASGVVVRYGQARTVADYVQAQFGRQVRARLVSQDVIQRMHRDPGNGLDTDGPVLLREVVLAEETPPGRPLAACHALLVPDRLPDPVQAELATCADPVDGLLARLGVAWTVTVRAEEGFVAPFGLASCDFSWLGEQAAAAVELTRLASIGGIPVAVLVDELPLPSSPRAEPAPV
jgi:hypothetical protein